MCKRKSLKKNCSRFSKILGKTYKGAQSVPETIDEFLMQRVIMPDIDFILFTALYSILYVEILNGIIFEGIFIF